VGKEGGSMEWREGFVERVGFESGVKNSGNNEL